VSLLLNLGGWQLRRAQDKADLLAAQTAAASEAPLDIRAWLEAPLPRTDINDRAVQVSGRYLPNRSLLQDSQMHEGQVGYHLWTPLETPNGLVLVNRGWLPSVADRSSLPRYATPLEPQTLRGVWRDLPRPGLYLGEGDCDRSQWPRVVQYPRLDELECLLQAPVVEGLLLLAADQPSGYVREWMSGVMPPAKHIGYAVQWFALALALSIIFVWVNIHRSNRPSE
jgi:surfeit locus 1 family protein